jgi:uncharacterized protein (TIGR03790 family)
MKAALLLILGLAVFPVSAIGAPNIPAETAGTVVIYNRNDPSAKNLADFYCSARGIDPAHEIPIDAPLREEISRGEYDDLIAHPIREEFIRRGYWFVTLDMMNRPILYASTIRYVALIRGLPLKIIQCSDYPGDAKTQPDSYGGCNAASVDSELSVLGHFSPQISGIIQNPLYHETYQSPEDGKIPPGMLFVSRLDGPTDFSVREMINNGIRAENDGLWGWGYIDLRSLDVQGYARGDRWIRVAGEEMRKNGIPLISDDLPETLQAGFPVTDASAYYGWYAENLDGPFANPQFQFVQGAVAVHLHSYSASTLHDPKKGWTGPLVFHGASATLGNVYEPYLPFTTDLGVFATALLSGRNLAESYYAAQPALSWMSICVGDPLYRPYAAWYSRDPKLPQSQTIWSDYRAIILAHGGDTLAAATELKAQSVRKKESLYLEALGAAQMDQGSLDAAEGSFREANALTKDPTVEFRILLEQSRAIEKQGKGMIAAKLLKENMTRFAQPAQQALLRSWIKRMESSSPTPAPSTTSR